MVPARLAADGAGFFAGGQFIIRLELDPGDARRYEYRQHIKGTAFVTQGSFSGTPSRASWSATGVRHDAKNDFKIPGGLQTTFTEDGETATGGSVHRFGYRARSGRIAHGVEDRYLPDQATGAEYRARDTWGLRGIARPSGLRIQIDIIYRGSVIDRDDGNRVVTTLHWGVHLDDIIV